MTVITYSEEGEGIFEFFFEQNFETFKKKFFPKNHILVPLIYANQSDFFHSDGGIRP